MSSKSILRGELFLTILSVLPSQTRSCFYARHHPKGESDLEVELHGVRTIVLRQFINEFLQYFVYEQYGLGKMLKQLNENSSGDTSGDTSLLRFKLSFHDSSFILPRSSSSYDFVNLEVDEATVAASEPEESFTMPTDSSPLAFSTENPPVKDMLGGISLSSETDDPPISRKRIVVRGFRMYSSLSDQPFRSGEPTVDSPSFRYYFAIDGRVKAGKRVYRPGIITGKTH